MGSKEDSPEEKQRDYERRLRETKVFLMAWEDELEMTEENLGFTKSDISATTNSRKVFIVHGRDESAKLQLESLLTRLKLEPIILHRMPDKGRTIIEKFEGESKGSGFAFVLLTPDDDCLLPDEETGNQKPLKRARQNVVLELGYFIGSLGRQRVCPIYKMGVEIPSDITGVLFKRFNDSLEELYEEIRKELVTAGYQLPPY
jgi:predicted nucleotide-binding protein